MKRIRALIRWVTRHALRMLASGVVLLVIVAVYFLNARQSLSPWHLVHLDEEFTAASKVADFEAYLRLEDRLFKQLDREVVAKIDPQDRTSINRFFKDSKANPGRWPRNWNRSYVLQADAPVAGALLLHGLTDSPYSLRLLAERLHKANVTVVGLRVPGHGTAPSGLAHTDWQDMTAAVRLAVKHLTDLMGGKPLFMVGYSNGGALAVEYTLAGLEDSKLSRPAGVVLLSPEIGVTRFAFLAAWQARLGKVLGLEKLAWSSIEPEYDPFKYNSFPINAGDTAYRMTERVQGQLKTLGEAGKLSNMPPLLAFQSSVDATVSAPALISHLFDHLTPPDHELVLFDVNRHPEVVELLRHDPHTTFGPLLDKNQRGYKLTVITNEGEPQRVVARSRAHGVVGKAGETVVPLDSAWPPDVFSVGHIALPFSPLDPLYGGPKALPSPGLALGHVALRGESGVLNVTPKALLRMHWNPFYDYVESRILQFMSLAEKPQS